MQYIDNIVLCILGFIALYWTITGIHTYVFPLLAASEDEE